MKAPSTKVILIGVVSGIVVVTCYSVFKHFQRKSAREALKKKVFAQAVLDLKAAMNTTSWKTKTPEISDAKAREVAQKVYNAIGYFTEDEDAIIKAFYSIKDYDDLSLIAYQYKQLFETDLYTAISDSFKNDPLKMAKLRSVMTKQIIK